MAGFDRRAFLVALGVLPAATALLAGCSDSTTTTPIGPDLGGADNAIRAQDDLYRHVNGTWLRTFALPADKSSYGSFNEVDDRTRQDCKEILESISNPAQGSDEQKIRDVYDAYLDTATIDQLGITPISDLLDAIAKAPDKSGLARVMASISEAGGTGLVELYISPDKKDSTRYQPGLTQSGIGLPDMSYYSDPQYSEVRTAYRSYYEKIATAANFADPAGMAGRVLDLETRIAAVQWNNVQTRESEATYNLHQWSELATLAPGFDWDAWLRAQTDAPEKFSTICLDEPTFITAAARLWNDVDLDTWRDYLRLAVVRGFAKCLPKPISDANFDFFSKTLSGVSQRPERWRSAVSMVNSTVGELMGRKYVEKHFSADSKKAALDLVQHLITAYRNRFNDPNNWMTKPTRDAALIKLSKISVKIGYPDTWRDYSGLTITKGEIVKSVRAAGVFEAKRELAKLGKPVDKSEWGMNPQTVNAYYSQDGNQIVFPAAILQTPFFDARAETAVNYGGIGSVIGHEIGHAFDDQGRKYDGDGNLHDWWTPADTAAFDQRRDMLVNQYNALVPEGLKPEQHVNGKLTIGENLADLRGLEIALNAYALAEKERGTSAPDYTAMFLSWGRIWREKQRPEAVAEQIATDPHSPGEFRCNQVLRNVDRFYQTFNLVPSDKLFLPPDQRVVI